jgi:hypothetical protein
VVEAIQILMGNKQPLEPQIGVVVVVGDPQPLELVWQEQVVLA